MPSLASLLAELRAMGVSPADITVPSSWFDQLLDQAEALCDEFDAVGEDEQD